MPRRNGARVTRMTMRTRSPLPPTLVDRWIVAAIALLVVWAGVTFAAAPAPGWIHFLLTLGVFLLIYRVVVRGTPPAP